ncbi:hypothetical protein IDH08_01955 [Pelagibacterales bacterium SAG-MED22]|nr:hypothetical protein [Pelagibacterales bacterium SAG-MED22]
MISLFFSAFISNLSYFLLGKTLCNTIYPHKKINIFEYLIYGFIITSFIAVLLNFFTPLNKTNNSIFLFLIVTSFFFFKEKIYRDEILIIFGISILLIIFIIFDTVNRPDAMMYHLPFSKILNEEKIIIGLSNLHFRFSHVSILQYSSAINVNYLVGDDGIIIPLASIYIFLVLYFFYELKKSLKEKNSSISKFILSVILIFIAYKINRYSKIGNDDIGHLIAFLIVYKFLDYKKINFIKFNEISLLSVFLLANKFSLILFCLIPIFISFQNIKFLKKIYNSLPFFFLIIWCIKNILISGCFLYPIEQTCLKNLSWIDIKNIKKENVSAEAWAKDWPNYNKKKNGMKNYIENFNWIETWSNNHFKKIIKNILPLIVLLTILVIFNFNRKDFKNQSGNLKKKFLCVLVISIIGCLIFFLKFPLYRYGYSYLAIFIALFFSIFMNFGNKNKIFIIYKFVLIFFVIILFSKQFVRHYEFYSARPLIPKYIQEDLELQKINLDKNFSYYYNENRNCWYNVALCTYYNLNTIKFNEFLSYKFLLLDKFEDK